MFSTFTVYGSRTLLSTQQLSQRGSPRYQFSSALKPSSVQASLTRVQSQNGVDASSSSAQGSDTLPLVGAPISSHQVGFLSREHTHLRIHICTHVTAL